MFAQRIFESKTKSRKIEIASDENLKKYINYRLELCFDGSFCWKIFHTNGDCSLAVQQI